MFSPFQSLEPQQSKQICFSQRIPVLTGYRLLLHHWNSFLFNITQKSNVAASKTLAPLSLFTSSLINPDAVPVLEDGFFLPSSETCVPQRESALLKFVFFLVSGKAY